MKLAFVVLVSACVGLSAAKCRFKKNNIWGDCDTTTGLQSRILELNAEMSPSECPTTRTLAKACNEQTCKYQRRKAGDWSKCDPMTNTVTVTRQLVEGEGCPAQVTEAFGCRVARPGFKVAKRTKAEKKAQKQERQRLRMQRKKERKQRRRANKNDN